MVSPEATSHSRAVWSDEAVTWSRLGLELGLGLGLRLRLGLGLGLGLGVGLGVRVLKGGAHPGGAVDARDRAGHLHLVSEQQRAIGRAAAAVEGDGLQARVGAASEQRRELGAEAKARGAPG